MIATVGAVVSGVPLSTVTHDRRAVVVLPAASRATAVSVCAPFASPSSCSTATAYGAVVSSAPSGCAVEAELHAGHADVVARRSPSPCTVPLTVAPPPGR